jgi:hypothetical protein
VRQGFLTRLRSFDWDGTVAPPRTAPLAHGLRVCLRGVLWASAHPRRVLVGTAATAGIALGVRRLG